VMTFEKARPLAEQLATDLQRAFLHQFQANALSRLGRADEAVATLDVCIDWANRNPDHPWLSGMLVETAQTLSYLERYRQSGEVAAQAFGAAERTGHFRHMEMASVNVGFVQQLLGDVDESAHEFERSRSLATRIAGSSSPRWLHNFRLARSLRMMGRYDQALMYAQAQIDAHTADGTLAEWWRIVAVAEVACCYAELGQHSRARTVLGTTLPDNPEARFRWLLARYRIDGSSPAAKAWADELVSLASSGVRPTGKQWEIAPDLCAMLPPDDALALVQRYADPCRAAGLKIYLWPMLARTVQALTRAGRTAEAATAAREMVVECAGRQPYGLYVPEVWWILHSAFAADGDDMAARAALERAASWIANTALPNVPDAFRDSFINRNPINLAVLAAARRPK
jgi:tetratricopeptide (TPR) repeat protein